jgi:hypothetical protein
MGEQEHDDVIELTSTGVFAAGSYLPEYLAEAGEIAGLAELDRQTLPKVAS